LIAPFPYLSLFPVLVSLLLNDPKVRVGFVGLNYKLTQSPDHIREREVEKLDSD